MYLELKGVTLPNNSFLDFNDIANVPDIGGGAAGQEVLNCRTDLFNCCNPAQAGVPVGEWYYPDGIALLFDADGATFRANRIRSNVRLWHRDNPPERGHFHCEVRNAFQVNQTVYVNICELSTIKHAYYSILYTNSFPHSGHWASDYLSWD